MASAAISIVVNLFMIALNLIDAYNLLFRHDQIKQKPLLNDLFSGPADTIMSIVPDYISKSNKKVEASVDRILAVFENRH
jgi:hypothetical protein